MGKAAVGAFVMAVFAIVPQWGRAQQKGRAPGSSASEAAATPTLVETPPPTASLSKHVGLGLAIRLMGSPDAHERLRGVERAASLHTSESLALLVRVSAAGGPSGLEPGFSAEGLARTDPRALLVVVRALAEWAEKEPARAALVSIVSAPNASFATRSPPGPASLGLAADEAGDDTAGGGRILLARRQAALALAASGGPLAVDALVAIARGVGPGQGPAIDALASYPPASPLALGGVALTTPSMIALAAHVGDLRALDTILGVVHASDPSLRAAAIGALGSEGDTRILETARASLSDLDASVRTAAASALSRLGALDAAKAVEALIVNEGTVRAGLRLAETTQGDGVVKAAAAVAVASADVDLRLAAVATLGRQTSPTALEALGALLADRVLAGSVASALSRSPNEAALRVIESMAAGDHGVATAPYARRLAARAYFVRRFTRGERSRKLDDLLAVLVRGTDARDRAVGVEAQVALGQLPLKSALADADARVRSAAGIGALALSDSSPSEILAFRLASEPDEATRTVLSAGLVDGDPKRRLTTSWLLGRAAAGGADAPFAIRALAERADEVPRVLAEPPFAVSDPLFRAHWAMGLGESRVPDAVGRLAQAYRFEVDVDVRRALVRAIAARNANEAPKLRRAALELAASLDPDPVARWTATRALGGADAGGQRGYREVAWIELAPAAPSAALPDRVTATLTRSDGLAVPFVFDDDGYAVLPGLPPGDCTLRLAPRLSAYSPLPP